MGRSSERPLFLRERWGAYPQRDRGGAHRIKGIREVPSAFGSTLAEWQGAGDREERWRERLMTVSFNVAALKDGRPVGMVSGVQGELDVELISLWVASFARGQGVGDRLVGAVMAWARGQGADRVVLSVKTDNEPARRLYGRHGFVEAGLSPESDPASPEVWFIRLL